MAHEEWAAREAEALLGSDSKRWLHVRGVAQCARWVSVILPPAERHCLISAAYLHDVGYAPNLRRTGIHQLDGARYLKLMGEHRLAGIVAHHSEARFEISILGFGHELHHYQREESFLMDALTYCDMMTGPTGELTTLEERIAEVQGRYRKGVIIRALKQATPYVTVAVERTEDRLRDWQPPWGLLRPGFANGVAALRGGDREWGPARRATR